MIEVGELTETLVPGVESKATVDVASKLVPPILTCWPPVVGPALGDTEVTVGEDSVSELIGIRRRRGAG